MERKNTPEIALIKIGDDFLIPTEIARVQPPNYSGGLDYRDYVIGSDVKKHRESGRTQGPEFLQWRHFKNDLRLSKGALDIELRNSANVQPAQKLTIDSDNQKKIEGIDWSMVPTNADGVVKNHPAYLQNSFHRKLFGPLQAAEVFLGKVINRALEKVDSLFETVDHIKLHITIPAYRNDQMGEGEDSLDHYSESANYRANLSQVMQSLAPKLNYSSNKLDFSNYRNFLYEPYGVFYYYEGIEKLANRNKGGATYLVVDMGGSTTDLAIVQVTMRETHSKTYPISKSIRCAGADFDRFLLKMLMGEPEEGTPYPDLMLREVERAKIEISKYKSPEETFVFDTGGNSIEINRKRLGEIVQQWWNDPKTSIKRELNEFVKFAQDSAESNSQFHAFSHFEKVFLAGGAIELPGLRLELSKILQPARAEDTHFFVSAKALPSSALASAGLAYEVGLRTNVDERDESNYGLLSRIEKVYMSIVDKGGIPLGIHHKRYYDSYSEKTILFDSNVKYPENAFADGTYTEDHVQKSDVETIRFVFQTEVDIDEKNGKQPIVFKKKLKDLNDIHQLKEKAPQTNIALTIHHPNPKIEYEEDDLVVRVKPNVIGRLEKQTQPETFRVDSKDETTLAIKLTPPSIEDKNNTIHLCIDFGMSNTAVAILSYGAPLPDSPDLWKPRIGIGAEEVPENDESWDDEPNVENNIESETPENYREAGSEIVEETTDHDISTPLESEIVNNQTQTDLREDFGQLYTFGPALLEALDLMNIGLGSIDSNTGKIANQLAGLADVYKSSRIRTNQDENAEDFRSTQIDPRRSANLLSEDYALPDQILDYDSETYGFLNFKTYVKALGYFYEDATLMSVWTKAMSRQNSILVLAGAPGAGKSSLANLLAMFFNRNIEESEALQIESGKLFHKSIPVSPAWLSSKSLIGGYNEFTNSFVSTVFLEFVLFADELWKQSGKDFQTARKCFLCLDEFNLSHPEQYMSEVLSRMSYPYESSDAAIQIYTHGVFEPSERHFGLRIPPNLKIIGTVNTDFASKSLSPKVLDRSLYLTLIPSAESVVAFIEDQKPKFKLSTSANLILEELSAKKLDGHPDPLLTILLKLSKAASMPVGFRLIRSVLDYLKFLPDLESGSESLPKTRIDELLDAIVCNFFFPRLPALNALSNEDYRKQIEALKKGNSALQRFKKSHLVLTRIASGFPGQSAF